MIRVELSDTRSDLDEAAAGLVASGRVDAALALFIESAMALRGRLDEATVVAGAFLETCAPEPMSPDALDSVLAAIDRLEAEAGEPAVRRPFADDIIRLPAGLRTAVEAAEARKGWKLIAPGIRQLKLDLAGATHDAEVLRIDAGAATPRHTHDGRELTLCLIGGFSDGRGSYGPGDISYADADVRHQPRADDDGPCYVLAVTDAGLRFEGLLGLLQKLGGR